MRIRVITRVAPGLLLLTVLASNYAFAVPVPSEVVYVISGTRIEQFDTSGNFLLQFGGTGTGNGQFQLPSGIAVDPATNHVWVADAVLNRIQEFDANGNYLLQFGATGTNPGQLYQPYGVAVDSDGDVWVADTGNNRVEEFTSSGAFVQSVGSLGGGNAQFNSPVGISIDTTTSPTMNTLFVADTRNYRVEGFFFNGTSTPSYIGSFGSYGAGFVQFKGPFQISAGTDANGNVLVVADPYNQRIFVSRFLSFELNAPFTFPSPYGVARDPSGTIWAVDYNANTVYSFDMNGNKIGAFGVTGGGPGQLFHPTYVAIGFKGV